MALLADVVDRVVDDVLADPLMAAAAQLDDRRQPFEGAHRDFKTFELTTINLKRQVRDRIEAGHAPERR